MGDIEETQYCRLIQWNVCSVLCKPLHALEFPADWANTCLFFCHPFSSDLP